ncbi:MAG TPA: DUF493 domain-containing protein, partial [Smithellaceae bacterium]|nr:DUF493 domain-containing protein [Smithellaceae bacterium]
ILMLSGLSCTLKVKKQYNEENRYPSMPENKKQKLQLEYPCLWTYKIIGTDRDEMKCAVYEIIRDRQCRITPSRQSETAKYFSMNVELTVESESHRTNLYEALKAHQAIKLVL